MNIECLNAQWFRTLHDVRSTLATWREEYNCERPHSSLDFRQTLEGGRAMALPPSSTSTENLQLCAILRLSDGRG